MTGEYGSFTFISYFTGDFTKAKILETMISCTTPKHTKNMINHYSIVCLTGHALPGFQPRSQQIQWLTCKVNYAY